MWWPFEYDYDKQCPTFRTWVVQQYTRFTMEYNLQTVTGFENNFELILFILFVKIFKSMRVPYKASLAMTPDCFKCEYSHTPKSE